MTANGSFAIANAAGTSYPRSLAARVAKPCAASDFRNDTAADDHAANRFSGRSRAQGPSHSGTAEHAPLWYGPRLRPAFVAQLLGQVLHPTPPDATSAAAAYAAAYEDGLARTFHRAGLDRQI